MRAPLAFFILPVFALACSAAGGQKGHGGSAGNAGSAGAGAGDGAGGGGGAGGDGGSIVTGTDPGTGGSADCAKASTFVYVLSDQNDMYRFEPDKKLFTKIGQLGCKTTMQPNSMAIDRNATAWVNYVEDDGLGSDIAGVVYKVSTTDASCEPAPKANLPDQWYRLGMGFSTDGQNTDAETLYVAGTGQVGAGDSPGLGKLGTQDGKLSPVGNFTGNLTGQSAELTGTGDGRLYGFFTTTPVEVAEVDKVTGAIKSSKKLNQVETPAAWAFSFWGGDFYLYTAPDPNAFPERSTNVTHYRPSDGSVDPNYMVNIGFRIVGAGVSTCAPLEPPK